MDPPPEPPADQPIEKHLWNLKSTMITLFLHFKGGHFHGFINWSRKLIDFFDILLASDFLDVKEKSFIGMIALTSRDLVVELNKPRQGSWAESEDLGKLFAMGRFRDAIDAFVTLVEVDNINQGGASIITKWLRELGFDRLQFEASINGERQNDPIIEVQDIWTANLPGRVRPGDFNRTIDAGARLHSVLMHPPPPINPSAPAGSASRSRPPGSDPRPAFSRRISHRMLDTAFEYQPRRRTSDTDQE